MFAHDLHHSQIEYFKEFYRFLLEKAEQSDTTNIQ